MNNQVLSVQEALAHPETFRVSIFGSARTKPGQPEYETAYHLAHELGKRNIGVVTGGGPGQMEASNKGHRDARSNVTNSIGLTVRLPFEAEHNGLLDIEAHFDKFGNRLDHFMALSNAVVISAGGIGTCLEFFYTLQLTQVKHICPIPIILIDPMWEEILDWLKGTAVKRGFVSEHDLDNIIVAKDVTQALDIIDQTKNAFDDGGGEVCINAKVYKLTLQEDENQNPQLAVTDKKSAVK
ncbi:LOG family protein [Candidatus Peregrinibacteria bacterium]|nr:LOG family protein [bacterium]NCQ55820.1 LOG family protein [Candidatus Parcubacteria bacterium]NCS67887.1 LOG family protein [Candidatus Peregrinibacteria bacterium]